mgnify:CR=1 FL=1
MKFGEDLQKTTESALALENWAGAFETGGKTTKNDVGGNLAGRGLQVWIVAIVLAFVAVLIVLWLRK